MARIIMMDASMTGSTEMMADAIGDYIKGAGHELVRKSFDFDEIDVQELLDYDGILIGSYTWDDDLPYEVEDFYEELDEVDLTGKLVGVFGSCDSFYDSYGAALETIAARVPTIGGTMYEEKLKVELEPNDEDIEHCKQFAAGFLEQLSKMG
ncbi:flavodoxin domain-containing protein [Virgibacillus dakarensis]|uniref:flavodoxin domain-containing protein n=1 Tax=Virgibacillus dakarensis TaxID=1917889 RepID=UPI000B45250C|nr:flavodoxin domain-containing protein [Virgibacillus dakarensis]